MKTLLQYLFAAFVCLSFPLIAIAQEAAFTSDDLDRSAREYEDYLKNQWPTAGSDAKGWLAKANKALKDQDYRRATGYYASAVLLDKDNADAWLALSRAYLAIQTNDANEKQSFPRSAASTAYIAYKRAKTVGLKAAALASLGESLTRQSQWRMAIDAYRASLKLTDASTIRTAYEQLVAEHGFRMLDYTVDSEASAPRLCIQFSEPLAKGSVDFAKFVRINGGAPASVKAENEQLCIEELLHGRRYEVKLRSGLPSVIADEPLSKNIDLTIYVRDRKPFVRFTGKNYVLPRTGQQGIPIVSVNTNNVNVEIYRIGDRSLAREVIEGDFAQPIGAYKAEQIKDTKGEKLWSGSMPVKTSLNEEVTTAFPVDELLPNLKPGLYVMTAVASDSSAEEWQDKATQWFVVSDLGLTALSGQDGVHAFVRSLASGAPVEGIELRLVARNNEVLETLKTDAKGYVRFDAGLTKGQGGLAPALLVARGAENDYGFLDLTKSAFDLSDRGVGGRLTPGALDALLYTERGVYRPGETVYLTALLRDAAGRAANLPLTMKILRPDGVEYKTEVLNDQGDGGRNLVLPLPTTAMTGTWRITAHSDPKAAPLGEVAFLVEDYTPERLEMTLTPQTAVMAPGEPAKIALSGRYLYGAPASGLTLEGQVTVGARPTGFTEYPAYHFGRQDETFSAITQPLTDLPLTGANGEATIQSDLPVLPDTTQLLQAKTVIRLREPSGRVIEESVTLPVKLQKPAIGIKALFDSGHVGEGAPAQFDIIAVGTDAKEMVAKDLKWQLFKVEHRYQWYSRDGNWDYETVEYVRKMANGEASTEPGKPAHIEIPVTYGSYRLEVTSASQPSVSSTYNFTSGWYVSETADTPDILELALDKESYKPGDTVTVKLLPQMAGEALVAVVSSKLLAMQTVTVPEGGAEASFTVDKEWGPGAYAMAILYRPMDDKAKRMPGRAVGAKWLPLDASARKLALDIKTPEKARPNERLAVPVALTGLAAGEKAHVTVAAVDVGILNLTNYQAPDPDDYYFGQRRLGMEVRDLYGRLIDGMQGVRGSIRSGGDGGMQMQGHPLNSEPVALFSGIVDVPESGEVQIPFDVPAFDGTLRVMAVAWSGEKLGHAVKDVIIRDSVVITATPPHFLNLGDKSEIHISLHNVEGAAGRYSLAAKAEGGVSMPSAEPKTLDLKQGERVNFSLPLNAASLGEGKISLALTGPDGFSAERNFKLNVSPAAPNVTRRTSQMLAAGNGSLTIGQNLIADLIPDTVKITVAAGRGAQLDVPGLLLALDRYPYGCAEQTVSRALPLLYFNEMAEAAGLAGEKGAADRINKSIERLANLQDASGSFGLWSPGDYDLWLTAYVTDFLARAKEKGYAVPSTMLDTALDRLKNSVNAAQEFESGGEELAYALYVLARSGRAVVGDLRYYADEKIEAFATPLAKAQIGAALAMYGDKERAERAFRAALAGLKAEPDKDQLANRLDYGTTLRDSAGMLYLVSESGALPAAVPTVADRVRKLREASHYSTTQENAWLLLAAKSLAEDSQNLALDINGVRQSGQIQRVLTAADLSGSPFKITNSGDQPVPATVIVSGAAPEPEPAAEEGFHIERQVFTTDGKPASLAKVKQNDRFVVVLKVSEAEAMLGHIVIEDRLPAGFEIENPKLLESADLKAFSWLKADFRPALTQFRDDKFVAAYSFTDASREKTAELTLAYTMRAVTPGSYVQPGATVEDMYRPGRFARTAPGKVEIARQ